MLNYLYAMIIANLSLFDVIKDLVDLIKDGDSTACSIHLAMLIAFYKIMIHLCSGDIDENSLVSILLLTLHHLTPTHPPSHPLYHANSPIVTIPYFAVNSDIHSFFYNHYNVDICMWNHSSAFSWSYTVALKYWWVKFFRRKICHGTLNWQKKDRIFRFKLTICGF